MVLWPELEGDGVALGGLDDIGNEGQLAFLANGYDVVYRKRGAGEGGSSEE